MDSAFSYYPAAFLRCCQFLFIMPELNSHPDPHDLPLPPSQSCIKFINSSGFPGGSVKNLPAMQEIFPWVGKIPWVKGMTTHSSILAWRMPRTEEPGGLQSTGSQRVRQELPKLLLLPPIQSVCPYLLALTSSLSLSLSCPRSAAPSLREVHSLVIFLSPLPRVHPPGW